MCYQSGGIWTKTSVAVPGSGIFSDYGRLTAFINWGFRVLGTSHCAGVVCYMLLMGGEEEYFKNGEVRKVEFWLVNSTGQVLVVLFKVGVLEVSITTGL